MFYVYALYNQKHDKIYIGQTSDLKQRLKMHNQHTLNGYTSRYDGTWKLIYSEQSTSRKEALRRENQLKSFRGREFVRNNIPR